MGRLTLSDLDAVTLDAFGTLLELRDPVPELRNALADRGVERSEDEVRAAFDAEVEYYARHKLAARTEDDLARLYDGCERVFLAAAGAETLSGFGYSDFFEFTIIDGVEAAVAQLRGAGLALAIVADWDIGLHSRLRETRLNGRVDTVVTAAEVGAAKPSPAGFRVALDRLGVDASRALHVGDQPRDAEGAAAAGMHFEPTPLREAVERLA